MSDPFDHLGLDSDADESAVKRAYAQRLRQTRPDDDPIGFQRLNEAYQAALARCRNRRNGETGKRESAWSQPARITVNSGEAKTPLVLTQPLMQAAPNPRMPLLNIAPAPLPRDATRVQTPAFDPAAFIVEYRRHCATGDARALARWLASYPAFWHLPTKHAAGRQLLRMLFDDPEYIPDPCFTATSEFFHLDDALNGIDPLILRRVRTRGVIAWLLRPGNNGELALRVYGNKTVRGQRMVRAAIKRATGPFCWWRDLPHTLRTGNFPLHVGKVLVTLCDGNLADLPQPLDPAHARFWIEAASAGLGRSKLLMYLARSVAALLLIPISLAVFGMLPAYLSHAPNLFEFAAGLAWGIFIVTASVVAIIWLVIGAAWLDGKLEALAAKSRGLRIGMFSVTPAFCGAAILVAAVMDPVLGTIAAIGTMFVAFWRSRAKHGSRRSAPAEKIGLYLILVLLGSSLSGLGALTSSLSNSNGLSQMSPAIAIVAITLAIWAYDWYRRGFLRPRLIPNTH